MAKPVQKNGKAPISSKNNAENISKLIPGAPRSLTDLPAECKAELDSKGLMPRWIDVVELKKNHGYHKQEWQPYKFECLTQAVKTNPFMDAASGFEGFLIRKQLVLAAKSSEEVEKQRNYLKFKNTLQSNPSRKAVEQFKEFTKAESSIKVEEWDERDEKDT